MAEWYRCQGYRVVARNWSCRTAEVRGEIDVVAERAGTLVFCEVKTRSSMAYGGPAAAVGPEKQARLRRLAIVYLRQTGTTARSLRFDVAAVLAPAHARGAMSIEVVTAAF